MEEIVKNLFRVICFDTLGLILLEVKFGLGSAKLIGKLKAWFNNIFVVSSPMDCELREFKIIPSNSYGKCNILITVTENEVWSFYELLEQFCFQNGFGGFEYELQMVLNFFRKEENKKAIGKDSIVRNEKNEVAKVLRVMPVMVDIVFVNGKIKRRKTSKLMNIS
jgi:hypothetical protein